MEARTSSGPLANLRDVRRAKVVELSGGDHLTEARLVKLLLLHEVGHLLTHLRRHLRVWRTSVPTR